MNRYLDLTPRERYIYSCLLDVNDDSPYGAAIKRFKMNATPFSLREVIKELTAVCAINPTAMTIVLGQELVEILMAAPIHAITRTMRAV